MLVLARKKDEAIVIGHNIKVVIVAIQFDKVRLGIAAPKEVAVHRSEIETQIAKPVQCACGSYAINPHCHGRLPGVDLHLCDVCYWRELAGSYKQLIKALP